ncbi:MAG: hypothetical protein GY924_20020 [Planctomycetaceae bacterium]|nr:hypothetical protein [Planctomycetaceae bacterium]
MPPPKEVRGNQDILRLIDHKHILSIGIRNPAEVIKKSQEIRDRANLKNALNVDDFVDGICQMVKMEGCVDRTKPFIVSLGTPSLFAGKVNFTVTDVNKLASNLEVSAEKLRKGQAYKLPKPVNAFLFRFAFRFAFVRLRGNQLAMSTSEALLDTPKPAESLSENLSAKDKEILASDDMLIVLGQSAFEGDFRDFLNSSMSASQDDNVRKFLDDLKYAACGIRLDTGIGTTMIAGLKSLDSKNLLGEFFDSTRDTTLARMPRGKILTTHALQADSKTTGGVLGSILSITRDAISAQIARTTIHSDSYQLDGLLSEALDRIKGGHLVLYESSNRKRYGDFSLLGVLTTDDPDAFLTDLTGLTPFVNAASMSDAEAAIAFPQAKIEGLVAELGESHYQRRELAKFKLKLLGARARPALEKATRTRDLELRLAAKEVLESFDLDITASRAELLKGSLLKKLKPSFTYAPQQETLAMSDIGILTMQFQSDVQQTRNKMETLFGPEWQKVKIATVGKEVLLLVGSETSILERAITKQKLPESALNTHKACQTFRVRANSDTIFEIHVAISRLGYLLDLGISEDKSAVDKAVDRVSSFGLTIKDKRVRVDTYTPPQDIKVFLELGFPPLL